MALTREEFINRANKIHRKGNYEYTNVVYINNKTKVKIICNIHGIFEQRPDAHLRGLGCKKCGIKKVTDKLSSNLDNFISRANRVHGIGRYDYSLVEYTNSKKKIKIVCPMHGIFLQQPNHHLRGKGCSLCKYITISSKLASTNTIFILKAKEVHGEKYDYSLVRYIKNNIKVKIICPVHGIFEQEPSSHLRKNGCPVCMESRGEKNISKFLDTLNIIYIRQKKFKMCKDKRLLPFDFYIPKYNMCVEFDGAQHFSPSDFIKHKTFSKTEAEEQFNITNKHDSIKTEFCKGTGMPLVRIPYKDLNRIPEVLSSIFRDLGIKAPIV